MSKKNTKQVGYLAPLNYDRYFKKVFSDLKIAKRFLEDFLDIEIKEIQAKPNERYLTDDAKYVALDFRCKIDNHYIIIEMQQWYKPDIIQRFYLYDALNTGLQLEGLPKKTIELPNNKVKEIKDYRTLLPTITIIWLVSDDLNIAKDYISIVPTPEELLKFIRDVDLWKTSDLKQIQKEREQLLRLIDNKTKEFDFLQKNKLIFAFQKNIVKNKRYKKYYAWFELAQKTLRKVSDKLEFSEYQKDDILSEVVRRLKKQLENPDEIKYIEERTEYIEKIQRYEDGLKHHAAIEARIEAEQIVEQELKQEKSRRKKAEEEKKKAEEREKKAEEEKQQANLRAEIYKLLLTGKSKEAIVKELKISIEEIEKIIESNL